VKRERSLSAFESRNRKKSMKILMSVWENKGNENELLEKL
jgi:hypothetical protein